jgi:hypothetical protein
MNVWAENPEWFDDWIIENALEGRLGDEAEKLAQDEDVDPSKLWDLDKTGQWADRAMEDFWTRYEPNPDSWHDSRKAEETEAT